MAPVSHAGPALVPALTCHEYCGSVTDATTFFPAGTLPLQVSTTTQTSVATDGLGGFTLGAALFVVLVAGYYLLRRRRTNGGSD